MRRDKQISEMARVICSTCQRELEPCGWQKPCWSAIEECNDLYNAGYRKFTDVAEEIFAEIEKIRLQHIKKYEFFRNGSIEEIERKYYEGAEWGLRQLTYFIAELKKKYIGKDINVTAKTEEEK